MRASRRPRPALGSCIACLPRARNGSGPPRYPRPRGFRHATPRSFAAAAAPWRRRAARARRVPPAGSAGPGRAGPAVGSRLAGRARGHLKSAGGRRRVRGGRVASLPRGRLPTRAVSGAGLSHICPPSGLCHCGSPAVRSLKRRAQQVRRDGLGRRKVCRGVGEGRGVPAMDNGAWGPSAL